MKKNFARVIANNKAEIIGTGICATGCIPSIIGLVNHFHGGTMNSALLSCIGLSLLVAGLCIASKDTWE